MLQGRCHIYRRKHVAKLFRILLRSAHFSVIWMPVDTNGWGRIYRWFRSLEIKLGETVSPVRSPWWLRLRRPCSCLFVCSSCGSGMKVYASWVVRTETRAKRTPATRTFHGWVLRVSWNSRPTRNRSSNWPQFGRARAGLGGPPTTYDVTNAAPNFTHLVAHT